MAKPTWVASLDVLLDNDTIEGFTGVGYYAHRFGLDVVNETGEYVRRFGREEYQTYDAARPAGMDAAGPTPTHPGGPTVITDPADVPREATGQFPTLTAHPQFDHCASGTRPTGPIDALWRWGEGRTRLCDNAEPWWTNIWFTVGIACIAAGFAAINNAPYGLRGAVVVLGFVFALVVTDIANPRNHHGYCEICGQCSAGVGVPAARTRDAAIAQMRRHGWTTHPLDKGRHHCAGHAHVPFTNPV